MLWNNIQTCYNYILYSNISLDFTKQQKGEKTWSNYYSDKIEISHNLFNYVWPLIIKHFFPKTYWQCLKTYLIRKQLNKFFLLLLTFGVETN